jgi:hypothetical protein
LEQVDLFTEANFTKVFLHTTHSQFCFPLFHDGLPSPLKDSLKQATEQNRFLSLVVSNGFLHVGHIAITPFLRFADAHEREQNMPLCFSSTFVGVKGFWQFLQFLTVNLVVMLVVLALVNKRVVCHSAALRCFTFGVFFGATE